MTKNNYILTLRFFGNDVSPKNFSAKELGNLLIEFQDSVTSIVRAKVDSAFENESNPFNLCEITNESAGLNFASSYPEVDRGFGLFVKAVDSKNFTGLPRGSFAGIQRITKLAKAKNCNAEFSHHSGDTVNKTVLKPNDIILLPEEILLTDTKDFYGEITRVGGTEPKVRFKTFAGKIENATATKELIKQIANKLYRTVKIRAEVKWIDGSDDYEEIKILTVEDLEVQSNSDLFDELREALGDYSEKYGLLNFERR